MPDIGTTLRDARERRRVDLIEVETETKIRARYLRALEEEDFELLPGPTYVKTFLRTYGEYLGVDAKLLVEEYKQRYERPSAQELTPFSTNLGSRRERRRARGPVISPGVVVGACVLVLLLALGALGLLWPSPHDEKPAAPAAGARTTTATAAPERKKRKASSAAVARRRKAAARRRKRAAARRTVRLRIVPEATVYVCLESSGGRALIDQQTLAAGSPSRTFKGRRFRVTFGNGSVRMRVGSRTFPVPETTVPIGYEIRPGRAPRRLAPAQRPTCT